MHGCCAVVVDGGRGGALRRGWRSASRDDQHHDRTCGRERRSKTVLPAQRGWMEPPWTASTTDDAVARASVATEEDRDAATLGEDLPRRPAATIDRGFLTSTEATSR